MKCVGTPLHYAAFGGQVEVAKLLMNRGSGLDSSDGEGTKALHCAARNGHWKIAETLIFRDGL